MWKYRGQKRPPFAEEPVAGQESVWDYPRPPHIVACNRLVEVRHDDNVIARSVETLRVLETASPPSYYVPRKDIDWARLVNTCQRSICEWKGEASYLALADEPGKFPVAWLYRDPLPAFEMLREHISFYPGRVACFIDGERVRPQHSEFYGGWITCEIVGPFKGDPGTGGW